MRTLAWPLLLTLAAALPCAAQDRGLDPGRAAYQENCMLCHGERLGDGQFGPPLKGEIFKQRWGGQTADDLITVMRTRMPPAAPGSLSEETYLAALGLLLRTNGVTTDVSKASPQQLKSIIIPK